MVHLLGVSAVYSPCFVVVKERSDDCGLVDLELDAEADTPLCPNIWSEPPEGMAGLGNSTLDFLINVDLM